MNRASVIGSAALCLSAMGWAGSAHAAPCASLPNPLFVTGSTAVGTLVGKVAPVLSAATGTDQVTVVYVGKGTTAGSCSGVAALDADFDPTAACTATSCVSGAGNANYWDATGTSVSCDLDATGNHIDLVLSDVYKGSCDGLKHADNLTDTNLLVIPFGIIAPKGGSAEAVDAREAYYVFGKGMAANVTPWVNDNEIFYRSSGSGTQITIFKNINIPVTSSLGITANGESGTGAMITAVGSAPNADQSIGFASLDQVDLHRDTVKTLAYRHYGQKSFYWADSTNSNFDKKNVRDGHYPLWGYEHAIVSSTGLKKDLANKFAGMLNGSVALPGTNDVRKIEANVGLIPLCAMDVSRAKDAGDFSLVTTGDTCSCFFEANVTSGSTTCKICSTDTDCTSGQHCRNTYCEAR